MSKPLITIGDGTDRQVTIFRSRSGSLCFEFWDTDISNACVDYDWESTQVFVEKDEEDKLFQELLKKQDREALLWALLEEEAGEVVEVKPSVFHAHGDGSWIDTGFAIDGRVFAEILESGEGVDIETGIGSDNLRTADNARSMILCLARAIQEQKRREVSGE